jgi:hypothetical protein
MTDSSIFRRQCRSGRLVSALLAASIAAASAPAADFVGFVGEGVTVSTAGGDRYVIDVFAEFAQSSVNVVNVFDASISNGNGTAFFHSDLNTIQSLAGTWSPASSLAIAGANPAVDSFVTIGGTPGSSNTTTLDPNFSPATASVPPADSGWYNSSPLNGNGVADPTTRRVLIGRFVTATPGDVLEFSAWITFADYVNGTNGTGQQVQGSVSIPYTLVSCDSLSANAATTSFDAAGTDAPVEVSVDVADSSCQWMATSDTTWVSLAQSSGSGDGSFSFSVDANPVALLRSATITVSSDGADDVLIAISQAASACTATLSPASDSFNAAGGTGSVSVSTNGSTCGWTASSNAS